QSTSAPSTQPLGERDSQLAELVSGMAQYRQGNFQAAVARLTRFPEQAAQIEIPLNLQQRQNLPYGSWTATAQFYLAMAELRVGDAREADAALAAAREALRTRVQSVEGVGYRVGSVDWLVAHIAAREAAGLF